MSFRRQAKNGASLTELCVGLLVAIPVFLFAFECAKLIIAMQINDNTCREAARVAASGAPASAERRAESVISRANEEKASMISDLRLVSVANTASPADIKNVQRNGGTVSGTVTVTTAAAITTFLARWLTPGGQFLTFQSRQSFPYTYVLPSPAPANE